MIFQSALFSNVTCIFFCIFSGTKLTPAGIPLPDALSENRQLSSQIMLISYPFNLSIVRYFSSKFAHMYLCGIHYQWFWPNCCKSNCFGDTDAIIWQAVGLMDLVRGLQPAWTINSPWLVKREVVIPSCRNIPIGSNQVWRLCDVGSLLRIWMFVFMYISFKETKSLLVTSIRKELQVHIFCF